MSTPDQTFNEARAARATSERRFELGQYTLTRRISVAPEAITGFQSGVQASGDDDFTALATMERTIAEICEPFATVTATDEPIPFADAWQQLRTVGDEYGPLDLRDLGAVVQWLISGVVERPTGQPSDSPDGSPVPATGTTSTGDSPSPAPALTLSTPDGASMRSTPA